MATPVLNYVSEQDYLEAERKAFEKHEYYNSEVFAMSGAPIAHNRVFSNSFLGLGSALKGLVASTTISVEKFIRNPDNSRQLTEYKSLTDIFSVSTVAINISLADIYEGIQIN